MENKYINPREAISLLKKNLKDRSQAEDVAIVMELAQRMEETLLEEFIKGCTLREDFGFVSRSDLMDYAMQILDASNPRTLIGVANNRYTFGRVDRFRYGSTPSIVSKWGLEGFSKVSKLGWDICKHLKFDEGLDAAGSFFYLSGNLDEDKGLDFLDKKVEGFFKGLQRRERRNKKGDEWRSLSSLPIVGVDYCGACVRNYFEGNRRDSLVYSRHC